MRLVVALFLSLLAVAVYGSCPSEEKISPCECIDETDYLEVSCDGTDLTLDKLKAVLQVFDKADSIDIFLDSANLGDIPYNFFEGFNIMKLAISHSQLTSLSHGGGKALTGLEDTLEELEVFASIDETFKDVESDLAHLRRLTELDISYNAIDTVGNDWAEKGPPALAKLTVSNNGIQNMADKAFKGLNKLESFSLDGNRFGEISRDMLPNPAPVLVELELDNNALTSLPEDIFSSMPALKELSLRTNGLTKIEEKTFKPIMQHLKILDLRGNPIECDSHLDWMKKTETSASIYGTCNSPHDKYGVELNEFLRS